MRNAVNSCRSSIKTMITETQLVRRYDEIYRERMRGLPICNERLRVEAVGFRTCGIHRIGVLITPWFMNLVLLPGDATWAGLAEGASCEFDLPSGAFEFTHCSDTALGEYLTAALFRTVTDFPDQAVASRIGNEVVDRLFVSTPRPRAKDKAISRRALLLGQGPA